MSKIFGETLRQLRTKKGYSQQQLSEKLFVDRSSIANWETGRRVPDALLIARIAECLDVDPSVLLSSYDPSEKINVILVDNEKIILTGGMPVIEEVMPKAVITGFTKPSEAIEYAKNNRVSVAFLDIEMGKMSGIELCGELLKINPRTNVIFLTAYIDYAFDAWSTGASGFMLKPITPDEVREKLSMLRYPLPGGERPWEI